MSHLHLLFFKQNEEITLEHSLLIFRWERNGHNWAFNKNKLKTTNVI